MPRPVDIKKIRERALGYLVYVISLYEEAVDQSLTYNLLRFIAAMVAVETHGVWERYAESRLVAALNHHPEIFLSENGVKGIKLVSHGLAAYLVRGGSKYFDFRSTDDLFVKSDRLVGKSANPFRQLNKRECAYLNALAAIRNQIVHRSSASEAAYRRVLETIYGIKSKPTVAEFLNAKDFRANSPARYKSRLHGLVDNTIEAIMHS